MFSNRRNLNPENFIDISSNNHACRTASRAVTSKDSPSQLRLSTAVTPKDSPNRLRPSTAITPKGSPSQTRLSTEKKPSTQVKPTKLSSERLGCNLCHRDLINIRFECNECCVNFCSSCRKLHYIGHTLLEVPVTNKTSGEVADNSSKLYDTEARGDSNVGNDAIVGDVEDHISGNNINMGDGITVGDSVADSVSVKDNIGVADGKFGEIKAMLPAALWKDFERKMEEVMTKAAIKAAPRIIERLSRRSSGSLLDFNIRDALKSHDTETRRPVTNHQPWTDADKRQLRRLKRRGYANDEIAIKMRRSAGAIAQQWRKQSSNQVK